MAVRSKRLASGILISNVATLIYTAQSGETTLVKTITLYNQSAAAATVSLGFSSVPTGAHQFLKETLAAGEVRRFDTWLVMPENQALYGQSDTASSVRCGLHGAELEGMAD